VEGVRETGAEVEIISTNERRIKLDEFLAADGVALGTPDYFSYIAGTIKTFFDDIYLWDKSGESVKGKPAVLFFSHGGGGRGREPFEYLAGKFLSRWARQLRAGGQLATRRKNSAVRLAKNL